MTLGGKEFIATLNKRVMKDLDHSTEFIAHEALL